MDILNNPNEFQKQLINSGYNLHNVDAPDGVEVAVLVNLDKMQAAFFQGKRKKPTWHFVFESLERLFSRIDKEVETTIEAHKQRAERKAKEKLEAVENRAAVKVGDVFSTNWGFDQTNVEFYQVVEKPSAATVVVREIGRVTTDEPSGYDSEYCKPDVDAFVGPTRKARLDKYGGFKAGYDQWATKTSPDKSHYRSWYA